MNEPTTMEQLRNLLLQRWSNWKLNGNDCTAKRFILTRDDGAMIFADVLGERFHFTTTVHLGDHENAYNYLYHRDEHFPEMTCSAYKTPKAIALELERRLLVPFNPMVETVLKHKKERDGHCLTSEINAMRLAPLVRRDKPRTGDNGYNFEMSNNLRGDDDEEIGNPRRVYARVKVCGDRIKVELDDLTIGEAEAILRIANDLQPFPPMGVREDLGEQDLTMKECLDDMRPGRGEDEHLEAAYEEKTEIEE